MTPFIYVNPMTMNVYKRSIGVLKEDGIVLYYNLTTKHTSTYYGVSLSVNIRLHRRPDETPTAVGL